MSKMIDLSGRQFGRLKILRPVDGGDPKYKYWESLCDCGNKHVCVTGSLTSGRTKSCGCLQRQRVTEKATHGEASGKRGATKEYRTWIRIKDRCYNQDAVSYPNYGGRGIKVCSRWLHSYENFISDMGRAPSKDHSIERKNINKDYTPKNCSWATKLEQMNNTSRTMWVFFRGERKSISNWCRDLGVNKSTVYQRIYKLKWNAEKALTSW